MEQYHRGLRAGHILRKKKELAQIETQGPSAAEAGKTIKEFGVNLMCKSSF